MKKLKVLDVVKIKRFKPGHMNEFGIINFINNDGTYHVSNMNMPFQGTISANFNRNEIEEVSR